MNMSFLSNLFYTDKGANKNIFNNFEKSFLSCFYGKKFCVFEIIENGLLN